MRALTRLCLALPLVFVSGSTATETALPPVDYPGAIWVPAADGNFRAANRPTEQPVDRVVVHDIEGPDTLAIQIFQRVGAKVSSHYVIGEDGTIFQMVREGDIAWHAGNSDINGRSIGIETHGYAYRPGFFSPQIYETEARLVRDITRRYAIPRDRAHIIGHAEVPNPRDPTRFGGVSGHTDPGPYWDWNLFMTLVRHDARVESALVPTTIRPGETLPVAVTLRNTGDEAWIANKAPKPREGLRADAPVVFLGTAQGTASAFSSLSGWMSPQYADVLKSADVAPGALGRFEFSLRGPRTLGDIRETLRAVRVPTAAQGGVPVAFGDSVPLQLRVVPWDISVLSPDAISPVPIKPSVASWTAKLPIGGVWAIWMAPPKSAKVRKKDVFFYSIGGQRNVAIPSKSAGQGWVFGGYHRLLEPAIGSASITVTLDEAPAGITLANAGSLRFVGPFPAEPEKTALIQGTTERIAFPASAR